MSLKSKVMVAALAATTALVYSGYAENKPAAQQQKQHKGKIKLSLANGKDAKEFSEKNVNWAMVELEKADKMVYHYEIYANNVAQYMLLVDTRMKVDEASKRPKLTALIDLDRDEFEEPENMNNGFYRQINFDDFKDQSGKRVVGSRKHTMDLIVITEDNIYQSKAVFIIK